MLLACRTTRISLQLSDNRITPLFSPSACLNLRKGAPHQGLQNPLNAFMGSGKSGPRLMCSGPCSLLTCLSSIVLWVSSLQESVVTRIHNPDSPACDWQCYSANSPKECQPRALEPRTAMRSWRQLSQPVCSSFYSTSEHSRAPLCRGLRGHVDPALRTCEASLLSAVTRVCHISVVLTCLIHLPSARVTCWKMLLLSRWVTMVKANVHI